MLHARARSALPVLLSALCSALLAASSQAQVWTQIGPAVTPTPRAGAVVVYDPVHKQMVLFGGNAVDYSDETWILDEDVWTKRAPSHSPEARADAYGFWDSPRNRVLVFGGNAAGQIDRSRIWTWNGDDWSSFVPAKNPPARRDAAVAYDSTRDRIVLFGGVVDGSPDVTLADTWEFDGNNWSQVATQASPIDRGAALMGYDPLRKITVLVGGQSESVRGLRYDTWTYDGSTWKEIANANVPRGTSLEMTWDPSQQKLLIAGRKETGPLTSWTFDGTTWSEQAKSSHNLNGIDEASLAFDDERGYALYLRRENQVFYGFRLRAGVWDRPLPVPQPGAGVPGRGALTFDSAAGEPRLFVEASAGQGLQSWRWDGVMWRLIGLSGAQVPNATGRIAYDSTREITVAFDARTYELEGATWKTKPTSAAPATNGALAHDAGHQRLLYFGGSMGFAKYTDASWTWDGSRWQELALEDPPTARSGAALAYDERRQRMVLFGGMGVNDAGQQGYLFDTWELNGDSWKQALVQGPTGLRDWPSMTYDAGRRRIVLWSKQNDRDSRLWEYDGKSWLGTEPPPIGGTGGLVGYDAAEGRLLLHDEQGNTWARTSTGSSEQPEDMVDDPDDSAGDAGTEGGSADDSDRTSADRRSDSGCALVRAPQASGSWVMVASLALVLLGRRRARRRFPTNGSIFP